MRRILKWFTLAFLGGALLVGAYAAIGWYDWYDAARDAPSLKVRVTELSEQGVGVESLSPAQRALLLLVEDPAFDTHNGMDLSTPGAGLTSLTQSLAKRLAFKSFQPGIGKIRQTAYALSLERHLTKNEILTLALESAQMGQGPDGWVVGFHQGASTFFDKSMSDLTEREFATLVAVLIAPSKLSIWRNDDALQTRILRIENLAAGECEPENSRDVWLDGCA